MEIFEGRSPWLDTLRAGRRECWKLLGACGASPSERPLAFLEPVVKFPQRDVERPRPFAERPMGAAGRELRCPRPSPARACTPAARLLMRGSRHGPAESPWSAARVPLLLACEEAYILP